MTDRTTFNEQVRDCDRSCRDINFAEFISINGVVAVLRVLTEYFSIVRINDEDGEPQVLEAVPVLLAKERLNLHLFRESQSFISSLQSFVSWAESGKVFLELTFFPNDIIEESFSEMEFRRFLGKLFFASGAPEIYVRYENASWKHGDIGKYSGVIFSHLGKELMAN